MMNSKIVFLLFLLISLSIQEGGDNDDVGGDGEGGCYGDDVKNLKDECIRITHKPLVIKGSFDESAIKSKLSSVETIEAGVEVTGTDIEIFDLLSNVKTIINPEGPAITFSGNKKMKRIKMESLRRMEGKENDVVFNKDQFPTLAYSNAEAYNDLINLRKVSRQSHGDDATCDTFMKIIPFENSGNSALQIVSIVVLLIGILSFLGVMCYILVDSRKNKKKPAAEGGDAPQPKQKSGAPNAPIKEDAKNK